MKWVDQDLVHRQESHHVHSTQKRVDTEHRNVNHQNIGIDRSVHLIHHQIATNHHQNIIVKDESMDQNHHRPIDLAEDIGDHQVLQAKVQAAAGAEAIAVAVTVHIVHHHQKNVKINHLQATWIKFDR